MSRTDQMRALLICGWEARDIAETLFGTPEYGPAWEDDEIAEVVATFVGALVWSD